MASRISFKVDGIVQGVNYRNFATRHASSLGITGFVKNNSDGTVSGEAQGDSSKLKEFVEHLNKGPPASKVYGVEQKELSAKDGENGFAPSG